MAFDKDYFTQVGVGGKQGQQLFMYYSQEDLTNYATPGDAAVTYFDLFDSWPQAASGDIILAFNAASPNVIVYAITGNDETGTTVVVGRGNFP